MERVLTATIGALCLFLASCAELVFVDTKHLEFQSAETYPKSHAVYKNEEVLADKSAKASKIIVDKETQRLQLHIGRYVAIDTPCTTGRSGKRTPSGDFTVTSKIKYKRSSIFGRCYYRGRFVCGGDKRKCRRRYTKFVGSKLPYWMRLTNDGIGIHASSGIRRYPASNGCIRLPHSIAPTIYNRTEKNTLVTIR